LEEAEPRTHLEEMAIQMELLAQAAADIIQAEIPQEDLEQ
jgi:hypothetical protein